MVSGTILRVMDKPLLKLDSKVMVLYQMACPSDAPLVPVAPKARKIKVRLRDKGRSKPFDCDDPSS